MRFLVLETLLYSDKTQWHLMVNKLKWRPNSYKTRMYSYQVAQNRMIVAVPGKVVSNKVRQFVAVLDIECDSIWC